MNLVLMNLSWIITAAGGAAALVLFVLLFFLLRRRSREEEEEQEELDISAWLVALGGEDNIKSASIKGSRLSIELIDKNLINRESLTALGVKSIITMSNKLILVVENEGEEIVSQINQIINKE